MPLSAIEALTVHEAASHAEALTRGAPEPADVEPPPTRLAARRAVEGHHRELTALLLQDLGWEGQLPPRELRAAIEKLL